MLYVLHREQFDTEVEAARAYDAALWRLKPREARNYANFKDTCPADVSEVLAAMEKVGSLAGDRGRALGSSSEQAARGRLLQCSALHGHEHASTCLAAG